MGLRARIGDLRVRLGIPVRPDVVSRPRPKLRPLKDPRFRAAGFTALALVFGVVAYRSALSEARWTWLRENPASPTVWSRVLELEGYRELVNREKLRKFSANLPYVPREASRKWITENRYAVAFFEDDETRVFVRGSEPPTVRREEWEPLGWGWEALHRFVLWSEARPYREAPRARPRRLPDDPRALRY